ncbi:MAG: tetraacyldisaccharide 4'-kinase, partial [Opitutales bacterium]
MPNRWLRQKTNEFEQFVSDVILGKQEGTAAAVLAAFLQLCSYLYSGAMQVRLWLYRKRIMHDHPLGCLVVVVGNLTWGGTGKTPVVEKFARALHERG